MTVQPEKFYEACITYHLVTYFDTVLEKKLYPFSISQIEEKTKGYDFGYEISDSFFFIQYKRPYLTLPDEIYSWKIELEQLKTINAKSYNIKTYYALPEFSSSSEWYEAQNKTLFINAMKLENQIKSLNPKEDQKTIALNTSKVEFDTWNELTKIFKESLNNAVELSDELSSSVEDIYNYIESLDTEIKNSTWLYIVRDER